MRPDLSLLCAFTLAVSGWTAAWAIPEDSFYAGKQLKIIVGAGPGGSHDIYGRFLANYIGSHIPGQPRVVVVNMPGASSINAANYLAKAAPKDGTEMLMIVQTLPVVQMTGNANLHFDLAAFNWIGNMSEMTNVVLARHDAGIATIKDAQRRELIVGSTGPQSFMGIMPVVMNETLGTKFKIVSGYDSGSELNLALERGEVHGRAAVTWSSFKLTHPNWLRGRDIEVLAQIGPEKAPDLQDVPLLVDLARNDRDRQVLNFYSSLISFGNALAVGPGVPPERVAILRRAFDETLHDPEVLAEVNRKGLEIEPLAGAKLQKIITEMVRTDPRILGLKH